MSLDVRQARLLACTAALLLVCRIFATSASVTPSPSTSVFTADSIVLLRVGAVDASPAADDVARPLFLDQVAPNGSAVQILSLPTADRVIGNVLHRRCAQSWSPNFHSGFVLSDRFLALPCYGSTAYGEAIPTYAVGNASANPSISEQSRLAPARVLARISTDGFVDTRTLASRECDGAAITGAGTQDGEYFAVASQALPGAANPSQCGLRTVPYANQGGGDYQANAVSNSSFLNLLFANLYVADSAAAGYAEVGSIARSTPAKNVSMRSTMFCSIRAQLPRSMWPVRPLSVVHDGADSATAQFNEGSIAWLADYRRDSNATVFRYGADLATGRWTITHSLVVPDGRPAVALVGNAAAYNFVNNGVIVTIVSLLVVTATFPGLAESTALAPPRFGSAVWLLNTQTFAWQLVSELPCCSALWRSIFVVPNVNLNTAAYEVSPTAQPLGGVTSSPTPSQRTFSLSPAPTRPSNASSASGGPSAAVGSVASAAMPISPVAIAAIVVSAAVIFAAAAWCACMYRRFTLVQRNRTRKSSAGAPSQRNAATRRSSAGLAGGISLGRLPAAADHRDASPGAGDGSVGADEDDMADAHDESALVSQLLAAAAAQAVPESCADTASALLAALPVHSFGSDEVSDSAPTHAPLIEAPEMQPASVQLNAIVDSLRASLLSRQTTGSVAAAAGATRDLPPSLLDTFGDVTSSVGSTAVLRDALDAALAAAGAILCSESDADPFEAVSATVMSGEGVGAEFATTPTASAKSDSQEIGDRADARITRHQFAATSVNSVLLHGAADKRTASLGRSGAAAALQPVHHGASASGLSTTGPVSAPVAWRLVPLSASASRAVVRNIVASALTAAAAAMAEAEPVVSVIDPTATANDSASLAGESIGGSLASAGTDIVRASGVPLFKLASSVQAGATVPTNPVTHISIIAGPKPPVPLPMPPPSRMVKHDSMAVKTAPVIAATGTPTAASASAAHTTLLIEAPSSARPAALLAHAREVAVSRAQAAARAAVAALQQHAAHVEQNREAVRERNRLRAAQRSALRYYSSGSAPAVDATSPGGSASNGLIASRPGLAAVLEKHGEAAGDWGAAFDSEPHGFSLGNSHHDSPSFAVFIAAQLRTALAPCCCCCWLSRKPQRMLQAAPDSSIKPPSASTSMRRSSSDQGSGGNFVVNALLLARSSDTNA